MDSGCQGDSFWWARKSRKLVLLGFAPAKEPRAGSGEHLRVERTGRPAAVELGRPAMTEHVLCFQSGRHLGHAILSLSSL